MSDILSMMQQIHGSGGGGSGKPVQFGGQPNQNPGLWRDMTGSLEGMLPLVDPLFSGNLTMAGIGGNSVSGETPGISAASLEPGAPGVPPESLGGNPSGGSADGGAASGGGGSDSNFSQAVGSGGQHFGGGANFAAQVASIAGGMQDIQAGRVGGGGGAPGGGANIDMGSSGMSLGA